MSGELQTIPARHGVATFVPRGRSIKIINTYGKQVVSTWAFGLHEPPEDGDNGDEEAMGEEELEEKTKELQAELEKESQDAEEAEATAEDEGHSKDKVEAEVEKPKEEAQKVEGESSEEGGKKEETQEEHEDPPEQAPDTPQNEKETQFTDGKTAKQAEEKKQPEKRTWSSYLPSIPYRSKGAQKADSKPTPQQQQKVDKAQAAAASKKWSSYIPTGQSFSSYVPALQVPDSKTVISAFQASHYRDPNKSYAEQLYDFSKTPVGAGSIAAATGSGTASSIYAAYSAYAKMNPRKADQPPMEYLSLPHTRAATHSLVPEVDETLLTNLRSPIMTLIEDSTPGAHDTLTAACDANLYAALGVDKPEEHGSCAENLVLALKELNEKAGLKGTKAVGADITVNIAPTPLHLFMNAPIELNEFAQSEGSGAKGARISVEEPQGKKRGYVRFRAERDMVIVMSACPMDVGKQNGGRCMAANFIVEEADEDDLAASTSSLKKKAPKKLNRSTPSPKIEEKKEEGEGVQKGTVPAKSVPGKPRGGPAKIQAVQKSAQEARKGSETGAEVSAEGDKKSEDKEAKTGEENAEDSAKPKKKPKKLERRSAGGT